METKELKVKHPELTNVLFQAKAGGLRCFTNQKHSKEVTYFYITDGTRMIYCQTEFSAVTFNSVHKPNRYNGTGFRMTDTETNITLENIEKYLNKPMGGVGVSKYKNWEEMVKIKNSEFYEL